MFVANLAAAPSAEGGAPADLGFAHPLGAAFGAALLSGVLGVVAVVLAIILVGLFFLLRRHDRHA